MNKLRVCCAGVLLAVVGFASAQELPYTEGPVTVVTAVKIMDGQFDNYMKWLRTHALVTTGEAKKQGLILDYKVFVNTPSSPDDHDVLICNLYESFGRALDFSQADEDKFDAIDAAHWKTASQDEQTNKAAPRLEMRKFLGTTIDREVTLRPIG